MLKYSFYVLVSSMMVAFWFQSQFDFNKGVEINIENDEWEHQSMAVNFAEGYGLYKLGGYTSFEKYDYRIYDEVFPFLRKLHVDFPSEYYHRNIGFSLVAGTIYKIFGNKSVYVRVFSFLLLIVAWLIFIITIRKFFGSERLFSLLVGLTPVFLMASSSYVDVIGDDIFVLFFISLIFFQLNKWNETPNLPNTIILGVVFTLSLVFKSTLIFFPLFLIFFIKKNNHKLKFIGNIVLIYAMMGAYIVLYSHYVNERFQAFTPHDRVCLEEALLNAEWGHEDSVFIDKYNLRYVKDSDINYKMYRKVAHHLFDRQFYNENKLTLTGQGTYLFIDGNNELSKDANSKNVGSWNPLWRFLDDSYYRNYQFKPHPLIKVCLFYLHKPSYIFPNMQNKLNAGFRLNYMFVFLAMIQLFLASLILNGKKLILPTAFAYIFMLMVYFYFKLSGSIMVVIFLLSGFVLFKAFWNKLSERKLQLLKVIYSLVLYFIFITLLLFGLTRYTNTGNAAFLSLAFIWIYLFFFEDKNKESQLKSD
ncbi:MAG: glycosyltransferase family 39 protein [Chitinophagales bacterium]